MSKSLYSRLVVACAILLSVLLTGLGIVLGQFFPLFAEDSHLTLQRQYWIFLNFNVSHRFCPFLIHCGKDDVAICPSD